MSGGTPAVPPLPAAPLPVRAAAWLLDLLLATVAGALVALPGGWLVVVHGTWTERSDGTYVLESAPALGLVLIGAGWLVQILVSLWNQGLRQGRTGRSIGKGRLGLTTVDPGTGRPIGAPRGALRWLAAALLGMLCLITYLWAIVDPRRRGWHDLLVGSLVVRD